jgi:hypothetical protein
MDPENMTLSVVERRGLAVPFNQSVMKPPGREMSQNMTPKMLWTDQLESRRQL